MFYDMKSVSWYLTFELQYKPHIKVVANKWLNEMIEIVGDMTNITPNMTLKHSSTH